MGAGVMNLLQARGAQPPAPSRYKPVWTDRFFQGYYTNRNPFRSPLSAYYAEGWGLGKTDALINGLNIELSPRLTLCRRPGWLSYSTASLPANITNMYAFRNFMAGSSQINLIVDTKTGPYIVTPTSSTLIYTKLTSSLIAPGTTRFLGLGNTLYMTDGVESQAWQVNGVAPNPRNWGIVAPSLSGLSGPVNPTIGSNITITGTSWSNPNHAANGGANYASVSLNWAFPTRSIVTDNLETTGYGLNAANGANVQGIVVSITGYAASWPTPGNSGLSAQLMKAGSPVGNAKSFQLSTTAGTSTLGGPGDQWGTTFLPADLNNANFGVAISGYSGVGGEGTQTWYIDNVQVSFYASGQLSISPTGTGSCSATSGYMYVAAYGNSNSGAVSSATPSSISTGAYSGKAGVQISLMASTDPQVNQIWLFRTADGGSDFYNIPDSPLPNTTQNYIDATATSTDDSQLNILLPAPIDSANNPPPQGSQIPVYWMGRIWVAVENVLYASAGPDTVYNGMEAFPPDNYWVLPSSIVRMAPTGSGLVLFMTDQIQMMAGGPAISQFYVQPLVDGVGLLSYDALDIYGSTAYLLSADKQFLSFDMSSGVTELGFPIEDKILTLNPTAASVAYHTVGLDRGVFLCDGSANWWRCVPQQPPDFSITGPVWSPRGMIASGNLNLIKSVETSEGNRQLLGANGSVLLYRDSSFSTFTDNGTAYDAQFTVGTIVLANPGQLAELGFITADFVRVGSSPQVSVLLDEISGIFSALPLVISDPPKLYGALGGPTSLYSNRYYFRQSTAEGGIPSPVWCRHLQITVDFGMDTVQNEILSNTLWGSILEEGAA